MTVINIKKICIKVEHHIRYEASIIFAEYRYLFSAKCFVRGKGSFGRTGTGFSANQNLSDS
jgi:hypothetical protein